MIAMLAGQLIPVGGQVASALIYGGLAASTLGGSAVQLTGDLSKAGGITTEDKKAIAKELAQSVALVAAGGAVGKVSTMAYGSIVLQNCPRFVVLSAKIGTDAALSVVADYLITGNVNLTAEGISQLIPVLVGVTKAKGSFKTYLGTDDITQDINIRRAEASRAHLETKGTEFYDKLSPADKAVVDKYNIRHDDVTAIHGILKRKLTDMDNKAVIDARYKDATVGRLDFNTLTKEQIQEINTIINKRFGDIPKEKSLIIVTGRGGSGKSTIIREQGFDKTHMLLDSDLIKEELPGYKEYGANYVHKASTVFNEAFFQAALKEGRNIVFPTTGWHSYVELLINQAHNAGYKIQIIHSNIDANKSIERAMQRFRVGEKQPDGSIVHRFVDPAYIESGTYVDGVIDKFKNNPFITEDILIYDNNGTFPPKLVEKITKK